MATRTQWLNMARLRSRADFVIAYGHAMLLSLVKLCITGKLSAPIFAVAQGLTVPISRGSPPIT